MSTSLSHGELRGLFLFDGLDDEQLDWIAAHADLEPVAAGERITQEGEDGDCFYVLLGGTLRMVRSVRGEEVEVTRTDQRGVYFGATFLFLGGEENPQPRRYGATVYAVTDLTLLRLPADDLATAFRSWFPMATHLLNGMWLAMRNFEAVAGQRDRLLALGALSAGLTHELNNPAAAAVRATASLRERVAGMRSKLAMLAHKNIDPVLLEKLIVLQERLVKEVPSAPKLSAVQASDLEDELGDWMDDHDVTQGWDMSPTFVQAGLTVPALEEVLASVGEEFLEAALRWLSYALETELLMGEIEDSTTRISTLVGAAKQYSQMDRAPFQWIDVHDGLDSTLVMLAGKLGARITVVKEYDRSLPAVPAYAGELNQVWTNIIDNAIAAMKGEGTLTVRTARRDDDVLVEISDTGPGIPPDITQRIFEPFFTTKPVGEGTGLGLDISWRIVVNRHRGDLRVASEPGHTTFQVTLPLTEDRDEG